jgi:hypothetical protein
MYKIETKVYTTQRTSSSNLLTYQWMLISSMPVAVSLKRGFESLRQYGSVSSRGLFETVVTNTLKMGYKESDRLFSFRGIKTDVLWG